MELFKAIGTVGAGEIALEVDIETDFGKTTDVVDTI